jgi:S-(hydroxymethyl)glutathione dehydrogenase/alcohol dehydrogenase
MGAGGIGINAVQGAAMAGAAHVIAVDPVELKRTTALQLGATEAVADIAEATDIARSYTNGQGADSAIVTVGVVKAEHVTQAFAAIRKAGTVVVTGLGKDTNLQLSLLELTLFQKRLQGSLYGACSPAWDIVAQAEMYRRGDLKLDELITTNYKLDEIALGFEGMRAGRNVRGVVLFN